MTLFSDGRLKMQYQTVPWQNTQNGMSGQYDGNNGVDQADKYDKPTIGIENAGGSGGIQISRNQPVKANSAYVIGHSCTSGVLALSVGYCPAATTSTAATSYGQQPTVETCDRAYADKFCSDVYGGQLASPSTQPEYDTLTATLNGADHPFMIGLFSDGQGHWQWTNGNYVNQRFLDAHSNEPGATSGAQVRRCRAAIRPLLGVRRGDHRGRPGR